MKDDIAKRLSAKEIFLRVMAVPSSADQQALLDNLCDGDLALQQKVDRLLAVSQHDAATNQLDQIVSAFGIQSTRLGLPGVAEDDSVQESIPQPWVLRDVGPYRLLEQIGEGGFGTVYRAAQTTPVRRQVALKALRPGMNSGEVIARFEAERQALAMMEHPNIAKVLDGGTDVDGRPYFVMELVHGIPVTQFCDESRLNTEERLRLFIDICRAVQHAHQKGIIHRDLKPSNVLVTVHDGQAVPKVIDFGIAKALHQQLTDHTLHTGYRQMLGTPLYMSPEQAAMNGIDIDTRSDIYSLGVMLYELLTGTTPFTKELLSQASFDELRRIIREQDPPRPSSRITTLQNHARSTIADCRRIDQRRVGDILRGELDWIVMKAIEKQRERRYETASALAADVQRYLDDEPVLACPPSKWYRFTKAVRRQRVLLTTASLLVSALIIGLVGTSTQAYRANRAERLADQRFENERKARLQAVEEKARADQEKVRADFEAASAKQAARIADEESAFAMAISKFLQYDILAQSDVILQLESNHLPDPNITLATVLDRASKKIGARFAELPAVEGSLHYTIAQAYMELGKYTQAEPHCLRAVEIGRAHTDLSDLPETARAIGLLGILRLHQHRLSEAEPLLLERYQRQTAFDDADEKEIRNALSQLVVLRFEQGRHAEAEVYAQQCLDLCRRTLGDEHRETLIAKSNLASQYEELGNEEKADAIFLEILNVRLRIWGEHHPDTLASLKKEGIRCDNKGEYAEARRIFEQVVSGYTQLYGTEHPLTLSAQANLGHVLNRLSQHDAAEQLLRKTLSSVEAAEGAEAAYSHVAYPFLASTVKNQGRLDEAHTILKQAHHAKLSLLGPDHREVIQLEFDQADLLRSMGRADEAVQLYHELIERSKTVLGAEHSILLTAQGNLAVLYFDIRAYDRALKILDELLPLRLKSRGPDALETLTAQINRGCVLNGLKRHSEARSQFLDVIQRIDKSLPTAHSLAVLARERLAEAWEHDSKVPNRYLQATNVYREILQLQVNTIGPWHDQTLETTVKLARRHLKEGKPDDAVMFLTQYLETYKQMMSNDEPSAKQTKLELRIQLELCAAYLARQAHMPYHPECLQTETLLLKIVDQTSSLTDASYREIYSDAIERLVTLYERQHEFGKAAKWQQVSIESRIRDLGTGQSSLSTMVSRQKLSRFLAEQERYEDAETIIRDAIHAYEIDTKPNQISTLVLNAHSDLLKIYLAQEKTNSVIEEGSRVLENQERIANLNLVDLHFQIALSQELLGNSEAADARLKRMFEQAATLPTLTSRLIKRRLKEHAARIAILQNRFDIAESYYRDMLSERSENSKLGDTKNVSWCRLQHGIVTVMVAQQRFEDAEPTLRELISVYEVVAPEDWEHYSAMSMLGDCLLAKQKFTEAEPLLLAGKAGVAKRLQRLQLSLPERMRIEKTLDDRLAKLSEARSQSTEINADK